MEKSLFNPVFLIPYYNHPDKIIELTNQLSKLHDIIVVDDGSDYESKEVLQHVNAYVFHRECNGGKGCAVKDGIDIALQKGYTHIFQVDADFQHDISKCDIFLKIAKDNPSSLICAHPVYDESAPKSRLYGRKITNFWCIINTFSFEIKDAMCGFRIYPLKEIYQVAATVVDNRMGFDIEILVKSFRKSIDIKWLDLKVNYSVDGVSHFRLFRDNFMISMTHARLFLTIPIWIMQKGIYYGRTLGKTK